MNAVGGQDELVFDGHSLAIDADGRLLARCPQFEPELRLCTIQPREIAAARLRETRHRENVRRERRLAGTAAAEPPVRQLGSIELARAERPVAELPRARAAARPRRRDLRRAAARASPTTSRRTASTGS